MKKAFLFDLNGTIIDDMEYHISAWYQILNNLGASLSYGETRRQCYGKNHELLERTFPGRFSEQEKNEMSLAKEKQYQSAYKSKLQLITGLDKFLKDASALTIPMAIGSAAIMYNIDFVLDGLNIRSYFPAIVSADDVKYSKPHPETFLKCAELLKVPVENCIVFEDSPKGVEAAANAGMQAIVITTMHTADEFSSFTNIHTIISNYDELKASAI